MSKLRNGLYKNPGGRFWLYEFRWRGKKHKGSTGCELKSLAELKLRQIRDDLALAEVGIVPIKPPPTFREILQRWMKANTGVLTSRHIRDVEDRCLRHMEPILDLPMDQITTERVEAIRTTYLSAPMEAEGARTHSHEGANNLIRKLKALLSYAVEQGEIKQMPFRLHPLPVQRKKKRVLPPPLVAPFLAEVDRSRNAHVKVAIRLMIGLGLREKEALEAGWECIDWHQRTYTPEKTKTGDLRQIPIPDWLLAYLKWLSWRVPVGLIIPAPDGEPHRPQFTKKAIARACAKVSYARLTPHRMRGSFATLHNQAGTPTEMVRVMLGHKQLATTEGYISGIEDGYFEAQDRVAALTGLRAPNSPHTVPMESN